jgi:hypothetical protein
MTEQRPTIGSASADDKFVRQESTATAANKAFIVHPPLLG